MILFIFDIVISILLVGFFYLIFTVIGKKIQIVKELRRFLCVMIFIILQMLFLTLITSWVGN